MSHLAALLADYHGASTSARSHAQAVIEGELGMGGGGAKPITFRELHVHGSQWPGVRELAANSIECQNLAGIPVLAACPLT